MRFSHDFIINGEEVEIKSPHADEFDALNAWVKKQTVGYLEYLGGDSAEIYCGQTEFKISLNINISARPVG